MNSALKSPGAAWGYNLKSGRPAERATLQTIVRSDTRPRSHRVPGPGTIGYSVALEGPGTGEMYLMAGSKKKMKNFKTMF